MSAPPNRFREHRERVGMTQAEVAAKIGIAIPTVARHEGGSRIPSAEIAELYATLYGVISAELFVRLLENKKTSGAVPNRLRELRGDCILTAEEVSKLVGISEAANDLYESGCTPPTARLKKYAQVYKITTAELFVKLPAYTYEA